METAKAGAGAPAFDFRLTDALFLSLDVKLLGVEGGVALHQDVFADQLFKFVEPTGIV
jgi:hypothetical protein